jgi:hypothetical protein
LTGSFFVSVPKKKVFLPIPKENFTMEVFLEITPLKETDVFVVLDALNNRFEYPLHNHPELEISLITGISGTRIVGDSTQAYQENDLVFLGPYLYHKWDGAVDAQCAIVAKRALLQNQETLATLRARHAFLWKNI